MFKLVKLKIIDLPFLGQLELDFVTRGEEDNGPYSTVLIGKNGTGKSLILRNIADIFEDLKAYFTSISKYRFKVAYSYSGELFYNGSFINFEYGYTNDVGDSNRRKLTLTFFDTSNKKIEFPDISPQRLAVSAYLVSDKFRFAPKNKSEYYIYLGLRETANTAGTKSYLNRIIPNVIDYIKNSESIDALKNTLEFLEFDNSFLEIEYKCRYKYHFFNGALTEEKFEELLTEWEKFSRRKSVPRYLDYFSYSVKGNTDLVKRVVSYLNDLSNTYGIRVRGNSLVKINLLQSGLEKVELLQVLNRLDLLESPNIIVKKNRDILNLQQASSGEFHYFTSILGLLTNINENSLILIDEPEISFHPNWQIKYIHYLKQIFKSYRTCHFIIATHSHFIISDLEPTTSNILRLIRNGKNELFVEPIKESTYSMSAEEILYRVFELRTYRNYFFEIELRELLHLLSYKSKDKNRIQILIKNLRKIELDKNDPLTLILDNADEYFEGM